MGRVQPDKEVNVGWCNAVGETHLENLGDDSTGGDVVERRGGVLCHGRGSDTGVGLKTILDGMGRDIKNIRVTTDASAAKGIAMRTGVAKVGQI